MVPYRYQPFRIFFIMSAMALLTNSMSSFGLAGMGDLAQWENAFLVESNGLGHEIVGNGGDATPGWSTSQSPWVFEVNRGQADPKVKFLARAQGYQLYLTSKEAVLAIPATDRSVSGPIGDATPKMDQFKPTAIRLGLVASNPAPVLLGLDSLPGTVNYFSGNTEGSWLTNIPTYAQVKYQEVYPGIDLVYHSHEGELEFDFVVAPGADPTAIQLHVKGVRDLKKDDLGNLVLGTEVHPLAIQKPKVYQVIHGQQVSVSGSFRLTPGNDRQRANELSVQPERVVSFLIGDYDPAHPLVIDPVIGFSTYLGGSAPDDAFSGSSSVDEARGIAADAAGNTYVTGITASLDFPNARNLSPRPPNVGAFVVKLSPTGTMIYSSIIWGASSHGIAVDGAGNAYITGKAWGRESFPILNAYKSQNRTFNGDGFVSKLNSSGTALMYSTYLGAGRETLGKSIAVDAEGHAYVTGITTDDSHTLATPQARQRRYGGGPNDAFVAKLGPSGSQAVYVTFLGGDARDQGLGITADNTGHAYVTGWGASKNFPMVRRLAGTHTGRAFVTKVTPDGRGFVYSIKVGDLDRGTGITTDGRGNVYACGIRFAKGGSPVFRHLAGGGDNVAIVKIGGSRSSPQPLLIFGASFGGTRYASETHGIAIDEAGNTYVTGEAPTGDFPLVHPIQHGLKGHSDAFVAKVNHTGRMLLYSTFLGGRQNEVGKGIAVDGSGNVYIAGNTSSTDFPKIRPFQSSLKGRSDGFVAKISPTPVTWKFDRKKPYLQFSDSPFSGKTWAYFHLENFEDNRLNTPGVRASAGTPYKPSANTDSVDADDRRIDGKGTQGHSFFYRKGSTGITFIFDGKALGGLPTHVGIAWTDGAGKTTFRAFDDFGNVLGTIGPRTLADGSFRGTTKEDRFLGVIYNDGISKIWISNTTGGIEVDHLQYGCPPSASIAGRCRTDPNLLNAPMFQKQTPNLRFKKRIEPLSKNPRLK